ncbi:peptidase S8/S53 domain-containing protein [Dimargaris cristalligena]|uniref:Peptidase S8/S53 domain-containing protein n=1 Tax=Dimargaris cristalligena TaxID=215637 RepID=A0A4P9ZJU7_9FUNG|nr:peptidase S8/S53 domain-containing protein [Dimargaris cristalligena]|eukprot:RKP33504.1 peptidase S8/S53 domain-containing protein [Dimargaris cristalligena]
MLASNYSDVFVGLHIVVDDCYQAVISIFDLTTNIRLVQISHNHTGVNTLTSNYGLTGVGIKVGIIDSGINYTHLAFGNCFNTTNCKVCYSYDLVGDAFNRYNTPQPQANPLDTCNGHGTHVARIITGNNSSFKGMALGATLGVYCIMGCSTMTNSTILIKALQMAYLDGMKTSNITLVQADECTLNVKATNVAAARAMAMVVYNIKDVPIEPPLITNPNTIPILHLSGVKKSQSQPGAILLLVWVWCGKV